MFPQSWLLPPIKIKATKLQKTELNRSIYIVRKTMDTYPFTVLQDNLKAVYIVKTLKFSGIFTAGTNSRKYIYIANNGLD